MNVKRIVLGGLLAGLALNLLEIIGGAVFGMEQAWIDAEKAIGKTIPDTALANALFLAMGFGAGIVAVWIYAAIRPRYGAGPRTAIIAAVMVFLCGPLMAGLTQTLMGWVPGKTALKATIMIFFEFVAATLLGGWVYKENSAVANVPATGQVAQAKGARAS
jgi:hypothetical protein